MKITQDPKAWREGFQAGQLGAPRTSCPYPVGDPRGLAWSSGYIEGKVPPRDRTPLARKSGGFRVLKRFAVICSLLLLGAGAHVMAHHAWGNYDASKPVTVIGPILTSKYEMPHVTLTVRAPETVWTVILAPPSRMRSRGASPEMLAIGKTISADGYPSRVNKDEMRAVRITVAGKMIEMQ